MTMTKRTAFSLCTIALLWGTLAQNAVAGETEASGFVTLVQSRRDLEIGQLRVHVANDAKCSNDARDNRPSSLSPMPAPQIIGHLESHRRHTEAVGRTSLPCEALNLSVGSWIRVIGIQKPELTFEAGSVMKYTQPIEVPTQDGAILEENPLSQGGGTTGRIWLNGFPLEFNGQTEFRKTKASTKLNADWGPHQTFRYYHSRLSSAPDIVNSSDLSAGDCVIYRAVPIGEEEVLAKTLTLWDCSMSRSADRFAHTLGELSWTPPDYARRVPGTVHFYRRTLLRRGVPKGMVIPPDRILQDYVTRVGMSVLPDYAKALARRNPTAVLFRFVLVRSLGRFAKEAHRYNGADRPKYENSVVPVPDGLILIAADSGIAHLQNEAQLAALLAIAETKVLQRHGLLAEQIVGADVPIDISSIFGYWQEAQALRIGIRQMYLAGYDIREAPFAWLVANGKSVPNPIIGAGDPGSTVPWYAAYAFNYISQYYRDVDYSKLKRGEKEYQQFLDELRKADPQAFEPSK